MQNPHLTPAQRYQALMFIFLALAGLGILLMVWAVEHARLPWYLHIPVAGLAMTLIPAGAMATGWAYYHYEEEQRKGNEAAQH